MQATNTVAVKQGMHRKVIRLMGNRFEITVVSAEEAWAAARIEEAIAEIRRIEKLLTTFDDNSQTNLINQHAGIRAVKVDREVFDLVQRSKKISSLTQG